MLCTGVRGVSQCRNRQHKLIQQRLMLSSDYGTHAVKTKKREIVMYKIKNWDETNKKTNEVEDKRN